MTDWREKASNMAAWVFPVLLLGAFIWWAWWMLDKAEDFDRLQSKCVIEQNQSTDWCWHWANAQGRK